MECTHCNIKIGCRTTFCPLCHAPFVGERLEKAKRLPRAFPLRTKPPFLGTSLFDTIYIIIALSMIFALLVAELVLTKELRWFWLGFVGLFYIYFLIRGTIQDTKYFSQKVLGQAVLLSVFAFALSGVIPRPILIFELILPCIYLISMIVMGIYAIVRFRTPRKHLINLISVAILGILPLVVVYAGQAGNSILAIVTASFGGIIIITTITSAPKQIINEIKRLFHI